MGLVPSLVTWLQSTHSLTVALILVVGSSVTLVREITTLIRTIIKLIEQIRKREKMKSTDDNVAAKAAVGRVIARVLKNYGLWCSILLAGAGAWILVARAQVANIGSSVTSSASSFSVDSKYAATGKMGDVDDVEFSAGDEGGTRFVYIPTGNGQHEWTYKYKDNKLNPEPAKFVGVYYLNPPDDFGMSPKCGWDLRGFHQITWEARSVGDNLKVEFIVGGVDWMWHQEEAAWQKVTPPYPDSMPRVSLGTKSVTNGWQTFTARIDQPSDSFKRVVGGFAWTMTWGSNHVAPGDGRKLTLEVRNVRYEK